MRPVAVPQQVVTLQNLAGEKVTAPIGVWLGCLLVSLPPEWREDVIAGVQKYIAPQNSSLVELAR